MPLLTIVEETSDLLREQLQSTKKEEKSVIIGDKEEEKDEDNEEGKVENEVEKEVTKSNEGKEKVEDKEEKRKAKCWYLENRGSCRLKENCSFSHEVCTHKVNLGYCKFGKECRYVHIGVTEKDSNKTEKCRNQSNCIYGNRCRFVHEQDYRSTIPCRFEREGRCEKGENCEYKHAQRPGMGPRYSGSRNIHTQRPQQYGRGGEYQTYLRPERMHTQSQNFQNWHQRNEYGRQDRDLERAIEIMKILER